MTSKFIDCHTHIGIDPMFYFNGGFPYAQHYRNLLEEARSHGIDRLVIFPFVSYVGWEGLEVTLPQDAVGADFSVPYGHENRRMMEEVFVLNDDISDAAIPFVIVDPSRRQKDQVASLRRLKEEYPIKGLKIQATMIKSPIRDLLTEGRCLIDLAEEWNVPMLIHSSIAAADIWSQASDILDIAESAPTVRFCLAHSCRFDLPSLERCKSLPNVWVDCSAHCIHCDAAVDERVVVAVPERRMKSDYSRPDQVLLDLTNLLPDRLMWGSDAPFYSYAGRHDGDTLRLLSTYKREVDALQLLSPAQKQAILHDNILNFLGVSHV